jgi:hypothetical protein
VREHLHEDSPIISTNLTLDIDYDESRNPPPKEVPKTSSPAPMPVPQKLDPDLERRLSDLRRGQREHGDKLNDILLILDRRR